MNYLKEELYSLLKKDDTIFDFLQESALDGLWYWDLENPENEWMNPTFWRTLGYDPAQMPHKAAAWQNIIFAKDLEVATQNFLEHCDDPEHPYDQVVRYRHKEGSTVWIRCRGMAVRDSTGKPVRMLGAHTDVTRQKESENRLRIQNERLNTLIEGAQTGIWEWNLKEKKLMYNLPFIQLLGYTEGELPETLPDLCPVPVHPDDEAGMRQALDDHLKGNAEVYKAEYRLQHKEGHWLWVQDRGRVSVRSKKGKPTFISGIRQDISEQRETASELEKYKSLLDRVNEAARIGTWEVDLETGTPMWSPITRQIHEVGEDYEPDLETAIEFYKAGTDRERITHAVANSIETGKGYDMDLRIITGKGNERWVRVIGLADFQNGTCTSIYGTFQDIHEKKTAEIALKESEERNRIFVEQSPNAMAMFDADMRYMAASRQWYRDYKLGTRKIIGKSHYEIFPEISDEWKETHQRCLEGDIDKVDEAPFRRGDGTVQWLTWDVRPWYITKDKIGGLIMYTADITDRKRMELKLKQSEDQFRKTFENSAIGMALLDTSGRWLKVNNQLCTILGYPAKELMKLTFQDITHPDDLDKDLSLVEEILAGQRETYQMEKRYFHKEGHIVWAILAVSFIRNEQGQPLHFVSQITDITAKKRAEQELQAALSKTRSVLNATSQVSIIGTDTKGKIVTFNKGAENLLGYRAAEVMHIHTPVLIHVKEEIEERSRELSEELGREISGFDTFVELARQGKYEAREWTYIRKNGSAFPVQLVVTPIRNNEGTITGFLGVATDISEIKEAEKRMSSLLEVTSDQNARLLNFAHIVSHNLRSHSGNLSMLLGFMEDEKDEAALLELVPMLRTAATNLEETIKHLNEVVAINTRIEENIKSANLNQHLESAIGNVQALLKSVNGELENTLEEEYTIKAVPAYLDSALLNLLTNAIKYRSEERALQIRLSVERYEDKICLSIADNGLGIDLQKHGAKLFGMYKTFHRNKDARGIGLFITKNQIEAMGGKIEVESTPDQGTTFKLYFHEED